MTDGRTTFRRLRICSTAHPQSVCCCAPERIALLFDDLVRKREKCRGNSQSQCPGNFEVDGKMKPARLLDGEIGRLRTLQYLVDIVRSADMKIGIDHVVSHQAAPIDHLYRKWIHARQLVPGSTFADLRAQRNEYAFPRGYERLRSFVHPGLECSIKIIGGSDIADDQGHAERLAGLGHCLDLERSNRIDEIAQHKY